MLTERYAIRNRLVMFYRNRNKISDFRLNAKNYRIEHFNSGVNAESHNGRKEWRQTWNRDRADGGPREIDLVIFHSSRSTITIPLR